MLVIKYAIEREDEYIAQGRKEFNVDKKGTKLAEKFLKRLDWIKTNLNYREVIQSRKFWDLSYPITPSDVSKPDNMYRSDGNPCKKRKLTNSAETAARHCTSQMTVNIITE